RYVVTVHNVDVARRNRGRSGWLVRTTLRFYYRGAAALIAHTSNIRNELETIFGITPEKIAIVAHGMNRQVRRCGMSRKEARTRLGLPMDARVLLMFGALAPYKGLGLLLDAFELLCERDSSYHLVIAGRPVNDGVRRDLFERIDARNWSERTRLYLSY